MSPVPRLSHAARAAALFAAATLVACGGSSGARGGNVPPPPRIDKPSGTAGKPEPKREVAKDTRDDYNAALQSWTATDKARGWTDATCRQAAERFAQVAATLPAGVPFVPPFGEAVAVADDAPLIDRLVAWNGRTPH